MGLNPWDVAAGALLVIEAGGRVGDFAGGLEFLRTNEVIAAAPGVFNPLREAIAAAVPTGDAEPRRAGRRQQRDRAERDRGDRRHRPQQRAEARRLDDGPEQPDGGRAHAERDEEPHAADARAHPVVDVAHDHRVGERDRAEHHDHERALQRVAASSPVALGGGDEQRHLERDHAEVEALQRIAVDQQADRDLRERCDDVDAREQRARAARDPRRCPRSARAAAGRCRWS